MSTLKRKKNMCGVLEQPQQAKPPYFYLKNVCDEANEQIP